MPPQLQSNHIQESNLKAKTKANARPKRTRKRKLRTQAPISPISSSASTTSTSSDSVSIASTGQEQSQDSSEDRRENESESESESENESESESESEAESTGEEAAGPGSTIDKQKPKKESPDSDESTEALEAKRDTSIDDRMEGIETQAQPSEPKTFSAWYLRQVTNEFAEDLDKLRSAPDFSDASLEILVNALKRSEDLYSDEAKRMIEEAL